MSQRLDYYELSPKLGQKLFDLSVATRNESIEPKLYELVHILTSMRNSCTFCIDMGYKKAVQSGEDPLRLFHVSAWRESNLFSSRERAAFEWVEAVTRLPAEGISDAIYEKVRNEFSEKEISDLTFMIATINVWNRLSASFHTVPGSKDAVLGLTKK